MLRLDYGTQHATDTCVYCFLVDREEFAVCEVIDSHDNRLPVCWEHAQGLQSQDREVN